MGISCLYLEGCGAGPLGPSATTFSDLSDERFFNRGGPVVAIEPGDGVRGNFLRTDGCAFVLIRAVTKSRRIHGSDHAENASISLRLALGDRIEMGDLGGHKKHGTGIFTGRHTGATADASGRRESAVRHVLGNRRAVGLWC